MRKQQHLLTHALAVAALAFSTMAAVASGPDDDGNFCMDVELGPFHMMPGYMDERGACAVKDYWGGWLQEKYYPFTTEEHLFNCDYFGPATPLKLPNDEIIFVPSSVFSEISGFIGGHPFTGTLLCASLTNWYQDSCTDPDDPSTCTFQLAQPFLKNEVPFHTRVTEVSVFDGVITVEKGKGKVVEVPVAMATRAAGITHLENLDPEDPEATQVGASVTHSLLGLLTYEADDEEIEDAKELDGSLDVLLQGHIFFPDTVENDPGAARVKGAICSKALYKLLNKKGNKPDEDEDEDD